MSATRIQTSLRHAATTFAVVLGLQLLHAPQTAAQETDEAGQAPTIPVRQRPIEEVEVIGERSILNLQIEIRNQEVAMYKLFNDLNSTDDFDVNCRNVIHTGTLIPTWECDAGFMTRLRFQNAQDFLQFGMIPKTDEEMYWENRHKVEALNAEMIALAKENPELAEAMLELHAKRQRMEEMQKAKREETRNFFGRLFGRKQDKD
jgi:hypothetical protein